ncbi:MAG: hypothetical protein KF869_07905 [Phycisphaeraceae bacterium]|nr:hypothetical protein [Phycisphaeraceae bacterium]
MTLLAYVLVALSVLFSTPVSAKGQEVVVLALTPCPDDKERAPIANAVQNLLLRVPAGTPVQAFDLSTRRRIFSSVAQDSPSERARLLSFKKELLATAAVLKRDAGATDSNASVPAFVSGVLPTIRESKTPVQLVIFSSLFHSEPNDPDATFSLGEYPSDGCVLKSGRDHTFGTADRRGTLTGITVHWCSLGSTGTERDRRAVARFWQVWCGEWGMNLSSCQPTPSIACDNVLNHVTAGFSSDEIDRTDTEAVIRRIATASTSNDTVVPFVPEQATKPESIVPAPAPDLSKPVTHEVELVFAQDGSGSMQPAIETTKKLMLMTVELGAKLTPRFELGVVVYRNADGSSIFPPTLIERVPAGGAVPAGMVTLRGFMEDPTLDVSILEDADGESPGRRTGERKKVSQMSPLTAYVDVERGVRASLEMLERGNPKARKILLLVGDMGTAESDGVPGMSAADGAAAERTVAMTRAFIQKYPDTRVLTVYCGTPRTSNRSETVDLFKRLAALAGTRGVFTDDLAAMEPLVTQAMLNP